MNSGTKVYRNYFPLKFGWQAACKYGTAYPCFRKLVYPGDVFKIHADLLIRYQPMLTPPMNNATATVRFGFVPLRLIEQNTELIITGSQDGNLFQDGLPTFSSVYHFLADDAVIKKNSELDLLYGIPAGLTLTSSLQSKLKSAKSSPALYFSKAFHRFWWDYYRDENFPIDEENLSSAGTFDEYYYYIREKLNEPDYMPKVYLKKDRITSSLPWQLKSTAAPTIEMNGTGVFTPTFDFGELEEDDDTHTYYNKLISNGVIPGAGQPQNMNITGESNHKYPPLFTSSVAYGNIQNFSDNFGEALTSAASGSVNITGIGFNGAQFREMMAQTRIFERLARCGSRYTEYLKANFGVAPSDGTLQRAQYLGGFKTHIVTTEVVQTAADGANPVGTLRGHGITHGNQTIKPFMAKEIGVIIGILDIRPETIYAQGVDRELCARSRFDFLNPSFQHLSEQEVYNSEVYYDFSLDADGNLINDQTWGFQPYAQELRQGVKHVVGEMRDTLSYWNQSIIMSERPALNEAFLNAANHVASYNRPFAVSGTSALPMIVDFGGIIEAYRPLVKDGIPGLVDHN